MILYASKGIILLGKSTLTVNVWFPLAPALSTARMTNATSVPTPVGVPLIDPVALFKVRPVGNVPLIIEYV
jgi:hypothetical protein